MPLRLQAAEAALEGKRADAATIAEAARQSTAGAKPLPMTGYKLDSLAVLFAISWNSSRRSDPFSFKRKL